jgi:hypothetical protein
MVMPGDNTSMDVELIAMPGDNTSMDVELIAPIAMDEGLRFAIREGGRRRRRQHHQVARRALDGRSGAIGVIPGGDFKELGV